MRAAIWGVTGYAGRELARLLLGHPEVQLAAAISREPAADVLAGMHPAFAALPGASRVGLLAADPAPDLSGIDVVFFALPHGASAEPAAAALAAGCRVIDLGADFRLRDAATYEHWYGRRHPAPDLLGQAVYGLPEWTAALHDGRDPLPGARLVAAPGCYPTGALLALLPLTAAGLIDPDTIIVDSKSGTSGAGRSPGDAFTFSEVHGNVRAYGVAGHRHTPEIEQALALMGSDRPISFTPHLIPASRGILTTAYARIAGGLSADAALRTAAEAFAEAYGDAAFVHQAPAGLQPETAWVQGSNHAFYQLTADPRTGRLIVTTAIDNLGKGAAGQAVQCLNRMFGLPETAGLGHGGLMP